MRIGILTHYYNSVNYGGVLQAFALASFLNQQNIQCEQICYQMENSACNNSHRNLKIKVKAIVVNRHKKHLKKRYCSFATFRNKIPHSNKVYTRHNSEQIYDDYDIIIVGSDQVWNFSWFDRVFFLDNPKANIGRIAYAASLGCSYLQTSQIEYLSEVLAKYDAVSVREVDAVTLLEPIYKEVCWVCDPVFLLSRDEWENLLTDSSNKNKKYIYCHFISNNRQYRKFVSRFAFKHGYEIVSIPHPSHLNSSDYFTGYSKMIDAGPLEFLRLIKNAEYVFTDSFHCVAFSCIFEKQVFAFQRFKSGDMSSRMKTIFEIMESRDHFISESKADLLSIENTAIIDYASIRNKIAEFAMESKGYLMRSIINLTQGHVQ